MKEIQERINKGRVAFSRHQRSRRQQQQPAAGTAGGGVPTPTNGTSLGTTTPAAATTTTKTVGTPKGATDAAAAGGGGGGGEDAKEKIEGAMPTSTERKPVTNADGSIKYAPIEYLVKRLTSDKQSDSTFMHHFLLTMNLHTPAETFLDMLLQELASEDKAVRLRVFVVLKTWVEKLWSPATDPQLVSRVLKLAAESGKPGEALTRQVQKATCGTEARRDYVFTQDAPFSVLPLAAYLAEPLPAEVTLDNTDVREVARQMTLVEQGLFKAIRPWELQNLNFARKDKSLAPNIHAFTAHFNVMSKWAVWAVMACRDLRRRTRALEKLIDLADCLAGLQNYNGVNEVVSACTSSPVYRLKKTWAAISPRHTAKFKELSALMAPAKSYAAFRKKLHTLHPPCIPFIGVYQSDLTFIEEGNPTMHDGGFINWQKCRLQAGIIIEIQTYQQAPYCLAAVPWIQEYFLGLKPRNDDNELWEISITVEPKERKLSSAATTLPTTTTAAAISASASASIITTTTTTTPIISSSSPTDSASVVGSPSGSGGSNLSASSPLSSTSAPGNKLIRSASGLSLSSIPPQAPLVATPPTTAAVLAAVCQDETVINPTPSADNNNNNNNNNSSGKKAGPSSPLTNGNTPGTAQPTTVAAPQPSGTTPIATQPTNVGANNNNNNSGGSGSCSGSSGGGVAAIGGPSVLDKEITFRVVIPGTGLVTPILGAVVNLKERAMRYAVANGLLDAAELHRLHQMRRPWEQHRIIGYSEQNPSGLSYVGNGSVDSDSPVVAFCAEPLPLSVVLPRDFGADGGEITMIADYAAPVISAAAVISELFGCYDEFVFVHWAPDHGLRWVNANCTLNAQGVDPKKGGKLYVFLKAQLFVPDADDAIRRRLERVQRYMPGAKHGFMAKYTTRALTRLGTLTKQFLSGSGVDWSEASVSVSSGNNNNNSGIIIGSGAGGINSSSGGGGGGNSGNSGGNVGTVGGSVGGGGGSGVSNSSNSGGSAEKRWFLAADSFLVYYKDITAAAPKRVWALEYCSIGLGVVHGSQTCVVIWTAGDSPFRATEEREIPGILVAQTEWQTREWFYALLQQSRRHQATRVFGEALDATVLRDRAFVPRVIKQAIDVLIMRAARMENLFTLFSQPSGTVVNAYARYRDLMDRGVCPEPEAPADLSCLAQLVLSYYAELPEPIIPAVLYQEVSDYCKYNETPNIEILSIILAKLSAPAACALTCILAFFKIWAEGTNSPKRAAALLGNVIMRPRDDAHPEFLASAHIQEVALRMGEHLLASILKIHLIGRNFEQERRAFFGISDDDAANSSTGSGGSGGGGNGDECGDMPPLGTPQGSIPVTLLTKAQCDRITLLTTRPKLPKFASKDFKYSQKPLDATTPEIVDMGAAGEGPGGHTPGSTAGNGGSNSSSSSSNNNNNNNSGDGEGGQEQDEQDDEHDGEKKSHSRFSKYFKKRKGGDESPKHLLGSRSTLKKNGSGVVKQKLPFSYLGSQQKTQLTQQLQSLHTQSPPLSPQPSAEKAQIEKPQAERPMPITPVQPHNNHSEIIGQIDKTPPPLPPRVPKQPTPQPQAAEASSGVGNDEMSSGTVFENGDEEGMEDFIETLE